MTAEPTIAKRINTNAIGWETPAEVIGQPPVYHHAVKGEVVDLPESFVKRNRNVTILVHYPVPGSQETVARFEPILLDPEGASEIETRAAQQAKADALREQLREIEGALNEPPIDYTKPLNYHADPEEGVVLEPPVLDGPGENFGDVGAAAEAKRRGRPLGSKNAPKVAVVAPEPVVEPQAAPLGVVLGEPTTASSTPPLTPVDA